MFTLAANSINLLKTNIDSSTITGKLNNNNIFTTIEEFKTLQATLEKLVPPFDFSFTKEAFEIIATPFLYFSAGYSIKQNPKASLIYGFSNRIAYSLMHIGIKKISSLFIEALVKNSLKIKLKDVVPSPQKTEIIEILTKCFAIIDYPYAPHIIAVSSSILAAYAGKKIVERCGYKLTLWDIGKLELATEVISIAATALLSLRTCSKSSIG